MGLSTHAVMLGMLTWRRHLPTWITSGIPLPAGIPVPAGTPDSTK